MSELSFAKSFLSTLDSRPIKLRADHVFDPEQVGLRVPVSLLYARLYNYISIVLKLITYQCYFINLVYSPPPPSPAPRNA